MIKLEDIVEHLKSGTGVGPNDFPESFSFSTEKLNRVLYQIINNIIKPEMIDEDISYFSVLRGGDNRVNDGFKIPWDYFMQSGLSNEKVMRGVKEIVIKSKSMFISLTPYYNSIPLNPDVIGSGSTVTSGLTGKIVLSEGYAKEKYMAQLKEAIKHYYNMETMNPEVLELLKDPSINKSVFKIQTNK